MDNKSNQATIKINNESNQTLKLIEIQDALKLIEIQDSLNFSLKTPANSPAIKKKF